MPSKEVKEVADEGSCSDTSSADIQRNRPDPALPALERHLPRINCPEHIILVVDICKEETNTPYKLSEGSKYSAMQMIKRSLSIFVQNKAAINSHHKYAIVALHEIPMWLTDFTDNVKEVISVLDALDDALPSARCDLTQLFDLLETQVTLPNTSEPSVSPPPYVVRPILLYGRSFCLPQFLGGKASFDNLVKNPYFFLDILYLHELPSDENKCEGIFDILCGLDEGGWSYVLEAARNATKLHNHCGTLLAHPLQRPAQKDAHYIISASD